MLFCSVRGKRYQREGNALFDDFWHFSSVKSTINEKFLYDSSRVVVGADPYNIKSKYSQHTCSAYVLIPPVSATPTAFASRIGQFPPASATPTAFASRIGQFPPASATPTAFASRIGQFPLSRRRQHTCFAYVLIPPCLGDADQRTACIGQFPQYTFGISPTITVSARATFAFISILKFDINVSTQTSAFISA